MRRYDVSDRARRQADFTINLTPSRFLAVFRVCAVRADDFASRVKSTQPLLGTGLADQLAATPGDSSAV